MDKTYVAEFRFQALDRGEARLIFKAMTEAFKNNTNAIPVQSYLREAAQLTILEANNVIA